MSPAYLPERRREVGIIEPDGSVRITAYAGVNGAVSGYIAVSPAVIRGSDGGRTVAIAGRVGKLGDKNSENSGTDGTLS
jgi:hypothetical protein